MSPLKIGLAALVSAAFAGGAFAQESAGQLLEEAGDLSEAESSAEAGYSEGEASEAQAGESADAAAASQADGEADQELGGAALGAAGEVLGAGVGLDASTEGGSMEETGSLQGSPDSSEEAEENAMPDGDASDEEAPTIPDQ
jgi:hypothetical protein